MSARVWIADRWFYTSETRKGQKKPTHGKGDRWMVQYYEVVNGERKLRSKTFKKRNDAQAFQTSTENSLREGSYVSDEVRAKTVADAAAAWIAGKKKQKPASLAKYNDAVENYVLPRWGSNRLEAITRAEIDLWVSALMDGTAPRREGMQGSGKGLAPATVTAVKNRLNSVLLHAVREGWISRNPASGVESPRIESDPIVFLTYPELERLIDAARTVATDQDALMIAVMGNIGLRPGEVVALQVRDVLLDRCRISISRTMTTDADDKPVVGTSTKTPAGARLVPIPPHLVDDLRRQIGKRRPTAPVFPNSVGNVESLSNWRNRVWSKVKAAADAPHRLTPKSLRHTAASLAVAAGADVLMVQRMLGHADAKETLNTYAKLFPDRMDEVTTAMSKARSRALKKAAREE